MIDLSLLFVVTASAILWFFAFFVPGERRAAIDHWRRDLSVIADTRLDLLRQTISEEVAEASFVATFPSVEALVSSAPNVSSDGGYANRLVEILSNFRRVGGDRSMSIRNAEGAALSASDGPAPGPDAVALAREAARTGESRVDLVREPDGFIGFVVAVPVRERSQGAEAGAPGAALVVEDSVGIFRNLGQPVRTAESSEALLTRRDGDQILFLSPLIFGKDPPLTLRIPVEALSPAARVPLAGEDSLLVRADYRNVRVFAAERRVEGTPWSLVIKVDEDEALAPFRKDVTRKGLSWGALLLALIGTAFGLRRAIVGSHEATIARGEARFGALVAQSSDAILLIGRDGQVLQANRAAEVMYGRTQDELLSSNLTDLRAVATHATLRDDIETVFSRGSLLLETRHRRADGSEFPVDINVGLVKAGDETLLLSIVRDASERVTAKAELEKTQQQFQQAQKMEAVGRLAGGVAHDFNNLLTVIQGYGEMVRDSLGGDPRHESMEEVLKATARATALTRQLLAFSRKQVLEPKIVRLGAIVRETSRMLERLIGEDIALSLALSEGVTTVKADPGQLEQVVLNLALNARDAMPGGGRLTISVDEVTEPVSVGGVPEILPAGRWVRLTVEDTGCGMDAETLAHAFEPFFTTKERGKGTGLGLSTVYGIVQQSDGHVQVTSAPGSGTAFRVYLPRSDEETTSGVRPGVPALGGTETVLVVEDEPAVRNLILAALRGRGYTVLVAKDGAGALDLVDEHPGPVHALLTDVVMPG